jgi:predicted nuclease with RNAse H fold
VKAGLKSLGVDVGLRKGLDLVLLDERRRVIELAPKLAHERFRETVLAWAPDVVGIDSPPRWATPAGMRETERAVRRLGIQLYATPEETRRSLKGFHDWMIAGMDAFRAIEDTYPLYRGDEPAMHALEVFPHGAAVVYSGVLKAKADQKHVWRRGILARQGVIDKRLRTPDLIDAALAALVGLSALEDCYCWLGRPEEGVIVLPCLGSSLPVRYSRAPLLV